MRGVLATAFSLPKHEFEDERVGADSRNGFHAKCGIRMGNETGKYFNILVGRTGSLGQIWSVN